MGRGRGEPGWMAKQIHKIDKLDASPQPGRDEEPEVRNSTIDDLILYKTPFQKSASVVASTYYYPPVPTDCMWIVVMATAKNGSTPCRPYLIVSDTVYKTVWEYPESPVASAASRNADVLANVKGNLILATGERLGVEDLAWQAGQTLSTEIRYYEVKL